MRTSNDILNSRVISAETPDLMSISDHPRYLSDMEWGMYEDLVQRSPFDDSTRSDLNDLDRSLPRSVPLSLIYRAELEMHNMYQLGCSIEEIVEFYSSFTSACRREFAPTY